MWLISAILLHHKFKLLALETTSFFVAFIWCFVQNHLLVFLMHFVISGKMILSRELHSFVLSSSFSYHGWSLLPLWSCPIHQENKQIISVLQRKQKWINKKRWFVLKYFRYMNLSNTNIMKLLTLNQPSQWCQTEFLMLHSKRQFSTSLSLDLIRNVWISNPFTCLACFSNLLCLSIQW